MLMKARAEKLKTKLVFLTPDAYTVDEEVIEYISTHKAQHILSPHPFSQPSHSTCTPYCIPSTLVTPTYALSLSPCYHQVKEIMKRTLTHTHPLICHFGLSPLSPFLPTPTTLQ